VNNFCFLQFFLQILQQTNFFDTEQPATQKNYNAPIIDSDNWLRCSQIVITAWCNGLEHDNYLIKPEGYNIPYDANEFVEFQIELF
jgi:DNA polymerase-3 subunit alpha